jgi:hypothetical protein
LALAAFMATVQLMAQQGEGPILRPKKPAAKPAAATLLVMCDLACNWKLDGETKDHIDAGGAAKARVELGQHVVVAVTDDGADQTQQFSEIKVSGQTVVAIELKPVRAARLQAQQNAQEEAARFQAQQNAQEEAAARMRDLRDHAGVRLKEGGALYDSKRYEEARPLFQKACDGGNMDGCNSLGFLYLEGHGLPKDYLQARLFFQKACDGGDMGGCNNVGWLYQEGQGLPKDYVQARLFFQKACDKGALKACTNLGSLFEDGQGETKDYVQARLLYQKACDFGNRGGDLAACNNLGFLYLEGHGLPKDYVQARLFFQKVCDEGVPMGCNNLGFLYFKGYGVPKDKAKARSLYQRACDGGVQDACDHLKQLH